MTTGINSQVDHEALDSATDHFTNRSGGSPSARMTSAVVLVTVTYGSRWKYLSQAIESARRQGIDSVLVVDNASTDRIAELADAQFGDYVKVLVFDHNTGSAGGYKAGIEAALASQAEYIVLLDDDNRLEDGCLAELQAAHALLKVDTDASRLAVLAYRPDRHADVAIEMPAHGMEGNPAAFFGFDLRDVPFKLFRRTAAGKRWIAKRSFRSYVSVATAPYSGLFFHRSVCDTIGLPDDRFLLYADDTDYSYRIKRQGGQIALVTSAHLSDLELSWNVRARFGNTLDALLLGDGDFRAYYSTRNNAYFENRYCNAGLLRRLNRLIYVLALSWRSVTTGRRQRYRLLRDAIRDGEMGRLGENPSFPIVRPTTN